MIYGAVLIAVSILVWALYRSSAKRGEEKTKAEIMKGELHDIYLAKTARERLDADAATARKLRSKYTRKE